MIYDYYCTDCGNRLKGEDIIFDLAQILDLHGDANEGSMETFIRLTPGDLQDLAKQNHVELQDGKRVRMEISLFDLLNYMVQDIKSFRDREALVTMTYDQFLEGDLMTNLLAGAAGQTSEVIEESVRRTIDAIDAKMQLKEYPPSVSNQDARTVWEQDTKNRCMTFLIEPEFFKGTKDLYTVRFSTEHNPAHLNTFKYFTEIRGYCPACGKPVLKGTGKYKHYLVGFIGAQSAGKTSLFVSMLNDLLESPSRMTQLGVAFPEVLSDSKFEKVRNAMKDNKKGWAVRKTDAQAVVESFNASLLVQNAKYPDRSAVLTFVDIAGELCYNSRIEAVDFEAFQKFPMIKACDLYMLCTCVSQKGYGDTGDENANIDNQAVMKIARGIYDVQENRKHVPPLCFVITKVDMAVDACEPGINNQDNPYDELGRKADKKSGGVYKLREQVDILRGLYQNCGDREILDAMQWCAFACKNCADLTYVSLISCSALGKPGRRFVKGAMVKYDPSDPKQHALTAKELQNPAYANAPEREMIYDKDGDCFEGARLDVVWDWILRNLGFTPTSLGSMAGGANYSLPYIPSYKESYKIPEANSSYRVRTTYSYSKPVVENRTNAIYQLYLNPSDHDKKLKLELAEPDRLFRPRMDARLKAIISAYLDANKAN